MNQWKRFTNWALIGVVLLSVGGMILYSGYSNTKYSSFPGITEGIKNEKDLTVPAYTAHDPEVEGSDLISQTQIGEVTADQQVSVSNSAEKDQEFPKEESLRNFPCPVQGPLLRSVGNYYSEAFDCYLFHAGRDYAEPEGTMIRATHGGKVIFSGPDTILGTKVTLDCGEGWLVTYGGLDNLRVQVGEIVETQDALGQVGLFTAPEVESNQPQLHYEVWHGEVVGLTLPMDESRGFLGD